MATNFHGMIFEDDARHDAVQTSPTVNGIDYLEVDTAPESDNQRVLRVYFLPPLAPETSGKVNDLLARLDTRPDKFLITGGARTTDVYVTGAVRDGDHMRLRINQPGDFSLYTLTIDDPSLDPYFASVE